jgi:hypothetical protein
MKATLFERLEGFKPINYPRVERGGESYSQTEAFTRRVLRICVWAYKRLPNTNQTARLVRDVIDFTLRRYQKYCIAEKIGGHYREVGIKPGEKVDFEHVIPAAMARDLLLHDRLTITEAMNIPTCMVRKKNHKKLNSNKLAKTTPSLYNFWERYRILKIKVETHDGTAVSMDSWTLDNHYKYFNVE